MIPTHVTSKNLSEKLKEKGVKQESEFYWVKAGHPQFCDPKKLEYSICSKSELEFVYATTHVYDLVSAFLASELGEMLPNGTFYRRIKHSGWWACYSAKNRKSTSDQNEAESRGLMLLHLLERGVIGKEGMK